MTIGQREGVWRVPHSPAAGRDALPVEVTTFAALRRMDPGNRRRSLQRPQFHLVALIEAGSGRHLADFVEHRLQPGTVVWIRPGMVHQWSDADSAEGTLVLFQPGAVDASAAAIAGDVFAPASWRLDGGAWGLARRAADHLHAEYQAAVREPRLASGRILELLLAALLLRIDAGRDTAAPPAGEEHEIFCLYRAAVEANFAEHHQVASYARELGYGQRALTRATRAVAGIGAKRYLDERIMLEAMRLLAHTGLPVSQCAQRLGFTDAGNFTTFFQRHTGVPPSRWRTLQPHEITRTVTTGVHRSAAPGRGVQAPAPAPAPAVIRN